ncbi:glucosyltransferase [Diaporthe australafricana]|uniref:Dol-P-Glc:Glc(2)Man(9)GlcNAc(2)-PP-Dol alpha-1,2-glucosyltransferase n=1 Tax=Diaporthe australafricana TaxID=127596 RepID=A0ABR3WIX4_9PEZI
MFPTQSRRAEPFPQYRSPYGPKYGYQPQVAGVTGKQLFSFGTKAAGLGGVALFAVIFYASGIPRVQRDILQRVPFFGSYFINEVPPEDNTPYEMDVLVPLRNFVVLATRPTVYSLICFYLFHVHGLSRYGWDRPAVRVALLAAPALAGLFWQAAVAVTVPEPYLDEVFHIPQAQKYCQAKWLEWDDKITTPPGLYAVSVLIHRALWFMNGGCSETSLRMTNWFSIIVLIFTAVDCRRLIEKRLGERGESRSRTSSLSFHAIHTGMNIGLFPLLFFFSALYYTDVFSTLMVLFAFQNHLERVGPQGKSWRKDFFVVFLGVAALFMRQTNVFWVVVFMGGLEAVEAAKVVPAVRPQSPSHGRLWANIQCYAQRSSLGDIYDPALDQASLDDVFYCALGIAIAVVSNPLRVMKQVWAHVAVMGIFVAFVLWNGSVVLGDKTNHVATVHLPQMLYIWPLFAFFSAPLLLPFLPWSLQVSAALGLSGNAPKRPEAATSQNWYHTCLSIASYAFLTAAGLAIVHFNTIIHPFTLADNRHYMFYVFRYSILRRKLVRYALVPAYVLCWSICWRALGGSRPIHDTADVGRKDVQKQESESRTSRPKSVQIKDPHADLSVDPPTISTALLWLLATALSLITAPLVEPRYFIMPWVFWRLLVPAWPARAPLVSSRKRESDPGRLDWILSLGERFDLRLFVETAWFLAIHLATAYLFIARPFYWRAEDGTLLDGGRVQRFMW